MLTLDFSTDIAAAKPRRKRETVETQGQQPEKPRVKPKTDKGPVEVCNYTFGVIGEPTNLHYIEEIFYRRHALRNALAKLEVERRRRMAEVLAKHDTSLAEITAAHNLARTVYDESVVAIREAKKKTRKYKVDDSLVDAMREAWKAYVAVDVKLREKQKSAYKLEASKPDQERLRDWVAEQLRTLLNRCGLHYHNYNDVVAACERFKAGPPPRFRPYVRSENQKIVVSVKDMTAETMFGTRNPAITFTKIDKFSPRTTPFISQAVHEFQSPDVRERFNGGTPAKPKKAANPESKRQRRLIRARAMMLATTEDKHANYNKPSSRGHSLPVFTEFQILFNARKHLNGPLGEEMRTEDTSLPIIPPGAKISHVHLIRSHRGSYSVWQVMLTISSPPIPKAYVPADDGIVGVDLGWRRRPEGVRVAYAVGSDGWESELIIPERELKRWSYPPQLTAILDTHMKACQSALQTALKNYQDSGKLLPDWLAWLTHAVQHETIHPFRLYATFVRWHNNRIDGDSEMYSAVGVWAERWAHLKPWERNIMLKAQQWRKDLYLRWCMVLRTKYRDVVLEDIDWRQLAKETIVGVSREERENIEFVRRVAAVSAMKEAMFNRFRGTSWGVSPENTTKLCHVCGSQETWDQARQLVHQCSKCGTTWDQDKNAAVNLLNAFKHGKGYPIPETRKGKKERKAAAKATAPANT